MDDLNNKTIEYEGIDSPSRLSSVGEESRTPSLQLKPLDSSVFQFSRWVKKQTLFSNKPQGFFSYKINWYGYNVYVFPKALHGIQKEKHHFGLIELHVACIPHFSAL